MDIRLFVQGATCLDPDQLAEIQEGMHDGSYFNFFYKVRSHRTDIRSNKPVIDAKDSPYDIANVVLWFIGLGIGSECQRPTKGIGDYSCGRPQGQRLIRG